MNKYFKIILKSLFLSILVNFSFLYVFSFIINTGDVVGIINGISIIFTIFLCTFLIINELKNNNLK